MTAVDADPAAPCQDWSFAEGDEMLPGLVAWGQLGSGRHFESWLAWSLDHWLPVVVKLPRPSRLDDEFTIQELEREVSIGAGLCHPGIQRVLGVGMDRDPPHVVLEYVEGPTLSSMLDEHGPLDSRDVVLFGLQLAGTLAYLHRHDLAHLDVKPGNVAVRDGRPVLLDLGIARRFGAVAGRGETLGSPPYMAPEQCRRHPISPSMDGFALGATLFELMTGDPPFRPRRTKSGWSRPQRTRNAPPVRDVSPEASPALADLVDALLRRDPEQRPAMTGAMSALHDILRREFDEDLWPAWVDALPARA